MSRSKFSTIISALFVFACVVTGAAYTNAAVYTNNGGQVNLFHLNGSGLVPNSSAWNLGVATSSPMSPLSVVGNVWMNSNFIHGGTVTCNSGLLGPGIEYCASDNGNNGVLNAIGNYNSGVNAYAGFVINNNISDNSGIHYAGFFQNSSNYTFTGYGTGVAAPNQTQIWSTDNLLTLVSSTSTPAFTGINFLVGGANTANEIGRFNTFGLGIGTTTSNAQLQVATSTANATTSVEFGKANQTVGSCITFFSTSGAAVYMYFPGASTVPTYTATQPAGCQK